MATARRITATTGLALGVLGLLAVLAGTALAGVGDYTCNDPSKVYYGNQRLFQRPATVDCDRVYASIPEYKEILRRRLTDKDAQYHILMQKASQRFAAAVKKMARADNHDLVAQAGSVRKAKDKAKDIPDRTAAVVKALD
ncbi:MAG: hypothetical protein P1V36_11040 [Planctomycetota bacterium]|nr:hypothetical protein [Planctomycetota bacterium]